VTKTLSSLVFQSRASLSDEDCWPWTGAINGGGYAIYSGKTVSRILYRLKIGELLAPELVRHICDNRSCVNWNHFIKGSHQDNMDDMTSRNRQAKGEQNGGAKLDADDVFDIREAYASGQWLMRGLAEMYGVSIYTISVIVNRKKWKHLP